MERKEKIKCGQICTSIDKDKYHHNDQNVVDLWGAAEWVHTNYGNMHCYDTHCCFWDQLLNPISICVSPQYQGQRKFFSPRGWAEKGIAIDTCTQAMLWGFYWQCKISSFFGIRIFKVRFMTQLIEEILNSTVREINVNWDAVLLIVVSLMKYIANRPISIY